MLISELITKLESLKEKHGDNKLRFTVKDHYSRYGNDMITLLRCGETTNLPTDWEGCRTNGNETTIEFFLERDRDNKVAKITRRTSLY